MMHGQTDFKLMRIEAADYSKSLIFLHQTTRRCVPVYRNQKKPQKKIYI